MRKHAAMAEIAPFAAHGFMAVAQLAQRVAATLFSGLGKIIQTGSKTRTGQRAFSTMKKSVSCAESKTLSKSTILTKTRKTTCQKTWCLFALHIINTGTAITKKKLKA
jgi:hypothetical protein